MKNAAIGILLEHLKNGNPDSTATTSQPGSKPNQAAIFEYIPVEVFLQSASAPHRRDGFLCTLPAGIWKTIQLKNEHRSPPEKPSGHLETKKFFIPHSEPRF